MDDEVLVDVTSNLPHVSKVSEDIGHRRNVSADSGLSMSVELATSGPGVSMDLSTQGSGVGENTSSAAIRRRIQYGSDGNSDSGTGSGGSAEYNSSEMEGDYVEQGDSTSSRSSSSSSSQENHVAAYVTVASEMETEEPGGEDSPDYPECNASMAIRDVYSDLVEAITKQVTVSKVASELYSFHLIEHEILDEITECSPVPETTKTKRVLNAVMSKIRVSSPDTTPFERLVELLNKFSCICDIATKIRMRYEELKQLEETNNHDNHHPQDHCTLFRTHQVTPKVCGVFIDSDRVPVCSNQSVHYFQRSSNRSRQLDYTSPNMVTVAPESYQTERESYNRLLPRQLTVSSEADSDENLTQEGIQECHKPKRLGKYQVPRFVEGSGDSGSSKSETEKKLRLTEQTVEELRDELEICNRKLDISNDERRILQRQFSVAQKRILQLQHEVLLLRRPRLEACATTCEHKVECARLGRQIQHMEDEKLEYLATIENLTQRNDMLLNCSYR